MKEKILRASVVANGWWLYDGSVKMEVRILQQNWDRYYEEGFDLGPEQLNEQGDLYFVEYPGSYSTGFFFLQAAKEEAAKRIPSQIEWTNDKLGPTLAD